MPESLASVYSVVDPRDNPGAVSVPPPLRKPGRPEAPTAGRAPEVAATERTPAPVVDKPQPSVVPSPVVAKPKYTRVNFKTDAGVYSVPALAVLISKYGVLVELPASDEQPSFVPTVGTRLEVGDASGSYPCYYPGTEFERPGTKTLVFIRAEDDNGKA